MSASAFRYVPRPDGNAVVRDRIVDLARHHFTRLDQIDQLVDASEADADLGFMARLLALYSLPRTNPKTRLQYVRRNGPYTLVLTAGGRPPQPLLDSPILWNAG